jgi:cell division transport system ATP-binding protein
LYAELPLAYGSAEVAGFQIKNIKKSQIPLLRRKCGIVFQDFKLLIDRNVFRNLEFVLRATGWKNKKAIQERIETVLTKVGMLEKQFQMPHQLSGGEQQRIVLARALLNTPPLILADEPTGNIDPDTSYQLIELLKEISETGKTIIIATHQYDLIEKYPGRVFCCENGELFEKIIPSNEESKKPEELPTPIEESNESASKTSDNSPLVMDLELI